MAVIELEAATVRRAHPDTHQRRIVMGPLDLCVEPGNHWVVLGPNGAGKTSMLLLAAAVEHPYSGTVTVLGGRLGRVDLREVRERIGFVQGRLVDEYAPWTSVLDVVLGGATGTILVRDDLITPADRERAAALLARFGCGGRERQRFASLSEGERRRVLVARALMNEPPLLLLDEPTASLDLPGREMVIGALERLAADEPDLATVTVVHHVEDIPSCATHALLLREGTSVAQGPIATALTQSTLSDAFGLPIELHRLGRRLAATVTTTSSSPSWRAAPGR